MNRALLASFLTAPLVAGTAVSFFLFSGEGRADSYVFGSLAVIAANAVQLHQLPRIASPLWRRLAGAAGVLALPLVAGGVTGLMLGLIHPRYPANEYTSRPSFLRMVFGGGLRGLVGAFITYPALLPAAILVFAVAWWIHARLERTARGS